MGLLRIILLLILVVYLVRFIDKYIAPAMFGKSGRKQSSAGRGEGDVTIEDHRSKPGRKKNGKGLNPDSGDYVDYEEIK